MSDREHPHQQLPEEGHVPARVNNGKPAGLPSDAVDLSWLEPAKQQSSEFVGYLHALRRRWLSGLALGMLASAILAAMLWIAIPVNYEAESLLQVGKRTSFEEGRVRVQADIDQQKEDSARLLRSTFVIGRAYTRDPHILQLPMVQRDRFGFKRRNPVAWLSGALRVNYLGNSSVLRVALSGEDQEQIIRLVDAIVNSYMTEVVYSEAQQQNQELLLLRTKYARNTRDIQEITKEIDELQLALGGMNTELARMQFSVFMEELRGKSEALRHAERERDMLEHDLRMLSALGGRQPQPRSWEIEDTLIATNTRYALMVEQIAMLEDKLAEMDRRQRRGAGTSQLENELAELNFQKDQLFQQGSSVARDRIIKTYYNIDPETERWQFMGLQTRLASVNQRIADLLQEMEAKQEFVDRFDASIAELEPRLSKVDDLMRSNQLLQQQMSELELQLAAQERVRRLQSAMIPDISSFWIKVGQVVAGSLFALMGVIGAVAYWDLLGKRVNSASDLDSLTGVPILGNLPQITPTGIRALLPIRESTRRTVEVGLSRCVDGIRTTLLCHKLDRQLKSILVTSALGEEGKTTVASQLAASLARSGRQVALVDGDLRNPQQHLVLGLPADKGLCEVLRSEASLDDVIRPTSVANLFTIQAGGRDEAIDKLLSTDAAKELFAQLRARFDFVVIDAGPVLANPDAMLVGQHVDTTLLSVRRDVSVIPKVHQACERLRTVGIHVFGVVLSGEESNLRVSELKQVPFTTAERPQLQQQAV